MNFYIRILQLVFLADFFVAEQFVDRRHPSFGAGHETVDENDGNLARFVARELVKTRVVHIQIGADEGTDIDAPVASLG